MKSLRKIAIVTMMVMLMPVFWAGCSTTKMGAIMPTVAKVATTGVGLAQQFEQLYAFMVAQKLVPDNLVEATKVLAAMDGVAPVVQAGAANLTGDKFNWVSFIVQAALIVAQVMGYVVPLL